MEINEKLNTIFLTNNFWRSILNYDSTYYIDTMTSFEDTIKKINEYDKSFIILEYVLDYFNNKKKKEILKLLKDKKIKYINISNDSEQILYADYIIVFIDGKSQIEGKTSVVLKEEKILKRLGFSLPFIVDLSIKLKCYGLIDKIYVNDNKLIGDLWN